MGGKSPPSCARPWGDDLGPSARCVGSCLGQGRVCRQQRGGGDYHHDITVPPPATTCHAFSNTARDPEAESTHELCPGLRARGHVLKFYDVNRMKHGSALTDVTCPTTRCSSELRSQLLTMINLSRDDRRGDEARLFITHQFDRHY